MKPGKLGLKAFDVHFGTFDYTFHVVVGPRAPMQTYVRWKLDDPDLVASDTARAAIFSRSGWVPVIWLPRRPRTPREYGALAHEILHGLRIMFHDWAGMPLSRDSDEAYCHAMSFAMAEVLEKLR